ncbi:MAG TPA: tubulin-like doman-containing protein, partial [Gemmataceae bacterium]
HLNGTPDLHSLPAADKPIIGRGLAKKPDERWPTCTEMIRAIKLSGMPAPPSTPISGPTTMTPIRPEPVSAADSNQMTRVQFGGSGRLGSDISKTQTPMPANPVRPSPPLPPMPPLVTTGASGKIVPRLVTPSPSSESLGPAITLNRPMIFQTARMNSLGIAPPEQNGDGTLFPALVIGVGYLGRIVLESLRTIICDHFGNPDHVPNVRFLYIDTDPEAGELATALPATPAALGAKELVLARLNRPTHYLQAQSLPPVDQWLPPGSLYKISRTPGAAEGVRAFGRLALFDNYRLVAQRIRQQLEMFLTGETLNQADQATMMGLRSNRPRAYVIAGLGGGTGSGMFIDLAFLIRQEMRALGYSQQEVVGMFMVSPADRSAARKSLGNACAALTELYHFQTKRNKYQTTFDKAEPPVIDHDAPYARTAIVQLPKAQDLKGRQMTAARAARALFNEILTPAGRVVDEVRDVYRNAFPSPTPTCQSFGLFRLTWPRPEVLGAATRRFAQRLMQRWIVKEADSLRQPVADWLNAQWLERKLTFEQIVEEFETAARTQLREEPERVFDAFVDPLRTRTPSGAKLDAGTVCSLLDQLLKLVGKPDITAPDCGGSLNATLETRYQELCKEGESQLAIMAVTFIEQPQYRLAGSEEAVRQIAERLKRQVDTLEPLHADAIREVKQTFTRLFQIIGGIQQSGAGWKLTAEVIDLLRAYPRKRLRLQILDKSLSLYRKLFGSTPDYLRDIGICRAGLTDMHTAIGAGSATLSNSAGPGRLILPEGCENLEDAADRFLAGLNPADVLTFDQSVQKAIARKFRGLAAVCLKPLEKGPLFRELLLKKSREFLDGKLDSADPAAVFFRNRTGGPDDFPL